LNTDVSNCDTGDGTCGTCTGGDVCTDGKCAPPPPDAGLSAH
jgi:hypothetical protein